MERNSWVGGRLCQLSRIFQSEVWSSQCDSSCVGPVQAKGAFLGAAVQVLAQTELVSVERSEGCFRVTLAMSPNKSFSSSVPDRQGKGVNYCSKTCCSVTVKQVNRLLLSYPSIEPIVVYYRVNENLRASPGIALSTNMPHRGGGTCLASSRKWVGSSGVRFCETGATPRKFRASSPATRYILLRRCPVAWPRRSAKRSVTRSRIWRRLLLPSHALRWPGGHKATSSSLSRRG